MSELADRLRLRLKRELDHYRDQAPELGLWMRYERPIGDGAVVEKWGTKKHVKDGLQRFDNDGVHPDPDHPEAWVWWFEGHWALPDGYKLICTYEQAIDRAEPHLDQMAEGVAAAIQDAADIFVRGGRKRKEAVLAREFVADRWPLRAPFYPGEGWSDFVFLGGAESLDKRSRGPDQKFWKPPPTWPPDVKALEAAEWARRPLNKLSKFNRPDSDSKTGDLLLDDVRGEHYAVHWLGMHRTADGPTIHIPVRGIGLLHKAETEVEADKRKLAIAMDSGRPSHDLLEGWRDAPKQAHKQQRFTLEGGRIELFDPEQNRCVQLTLDLPGETPQEAFYRGLKEVRDWFGIRNWIAMQRLLSVEGDRQGFVRWSLDLHMAALGYTPQERTRAPIRKKVADIVTAFTKLTLVAYGKDGKTKMWRDAPLIHVGQRYGRIEKGKHVLDGMQLCINPALYYGVRHQETGKLGSNWYPAPVELPQLDHSKFQYALALGAIIPIRLRRAWKTEGKTHLEYQGATWLQVAGIKYRSRQATRTWEQLERNLDKLVAIKSLGSWEWTRDPRTRHGLLRVSAPAWAVDRTLRGIRPSAAQLPQRADHVMTGADLRELRRERGVSQVALARASGVSRRTIIRAEQDPDAPLTTALADAVRQLGM